MGCQINHKRTPETQKTPLKRPVVGNVSNHICRMISWFLGCPCFITCGSPTSKIRDNNGAKTPKYQTDGAFRTRHIKLATAPNPIPIGFREILT